MNADMTVFNIRIIDPHLYPIENSARIITSVKNLDLPLVKMCYRWVEACQANAIAVSVCGRHPIFRRADGSMHIRLPSNRF